MKKNQEVDIVNSNSFQQELSPEDKRVVKSIVDKGIYRRTILRKTVRDHGLDSKIYKIKCTEYQEWEEEVALPKLNELCLKYKIVFVSGPLAQNKNPSQKIEFIPRVIDSRMKSTIMFIIIDDANKKIPNTLMETMLQALSN